MTKQTFEGLIWTEISSSGKSHIFFQLFRLFGFITDVPKAKSLQQLVK
jgi:hypothetical protein